MNSPLTSNLYPLSPLHTTLFWACCALFFLNVVFAPADAFAEESSIIVFDASGSMWGQVEGRTKIEIAREAVKSILNSWPSEQALGLVAYGHRKKGSCDDIETLIPVGALNKEIFRTQVDAITPKGMTPLTAAVKHAAEELKYTEQAATVILISDGVETCNLNPCEVGKSLEDAGVAFTAHVIGFDVTSIEEQAGLKCLAESTGGVFLPARNAAELQNALQQATSRETPTPTPSPTPLPAAKLIAPASAIKATEIPLRFEVEGEARPGGYVYIFKKGGERSLGYVRVALEAGDYGESKLRLPVELGMYELRWVDGPAESVVAKSELEIVDAEVKLAASTEGITGSEFRVTPEGPPGLTGYIYLYRKGEERSVTYARVVEKDSEGYEPSVLSLPSVAGEYEIKWLASSEEVLATAPLTIQKAEVSLQHEAKAPGGTALQVNISAPEGLTGYLYLFRKGKERSITYGRVVARALGGYEPVELRLPALPGEYEIKWKGSDENSLAESRVVVEKADITLSFPSEVIADEPFEVKIQAPPSITGYIYLYPKGKDKELDYGSVREGSIEDYEPTQMKAPVTPGTYELKWLSPYNEVLAGGEVSVVLPNDG